MNANYRCNDCGHRQIQVQIEMREKRLDDINGWFIEAFTEANDEVLKSISDAIKTEDELLTGRLVVQQVRAYCTPSDEDVIEEMKDWDGGF